MEPSIALFFLREKITKPLPHRSYLKDFFPTPQLKRGFFFPFFFNTADFAVFLTSGLALNLHIVFGPCLVPLRNSLAPLFLLWHLFSVKNQKTDKRRRILYFPRYAARVKIEWIFFLFFIYPRRKHFVQSWI